MNSYPFLDNKVRPIFTTTLGEITPKTPSQRVIDVSNSSLVPAQSLRRKLDRLHDAGEIDGGLPIVRHGVLVGLIPAPDLEFALDKLEDEEQALCLMSHNVRWQDAEEEGIDEETDPRDFTPFIDPVSSPVPNPCLLS
jgi:chloride channel 3/4/5